MKPDAPLHAQNPTGRFSDRVEDYVRFRPTYPAAAIDAVLDGLGSTTDLVAADVGAGTGISSRLLAARGVHVKAIEPNDAMRAAAAAQAVEGGGGAIEWLSGTAEATGLAGESVGLVLCAQAFHWFRPEAALAEFARVLRAAGRVALMWNDRDDTDGFTHRYGELIVAASNNNAAAIGHTRPEPLFACPLFKNARREEYVHEQQLDEAGLVGRALSASYVPKAGPVREQLERDLRSLHGAHATPDGTVTMRYLTRVFLAEKA